MIFIPMAHHARTPATTRYSHELGQRFDDAVREFRRQHPDLSEADIRAALMTSLQRTGAPAEEARQRKVAILVIVSIAIAFAGTALMAGQPAGEGKDTTYRILAVVAAVAGLAIAAIRIARRQ